MFLGKWRLRVGAHAVLTDDRNSFCRGIEANLLQKVALRSCVNVHVDWVPLEWIRIQQGPITWLCLP